MSVTLYHGDCFDIFRQIPDESIDFIAADVPYGILKHKIETKVDIPRYFAECKRVLKPNSFNLFFGRQPTLTTWNAEAFKVFEYKEEIIWYKRISSSPVGDMKRSFENITVCVKGKRKFNQTHRSWVDVQESLAEFRDFGSITKIINYLTHPYKSKMTYEDAVRFIDNDCGIDILDKKRPTKDNGQNVTITKRYSIDSLWYSIKFAVNGVTPQNLISFMPHNRQSIDTTGHGGGEHNVKHPTVKPVNMLEYLIQLCSNEGDVVLDPFMGSGTTMLACLNTNRKGIGIELDADYFEIARERVESARSKAMLDTPIQLNTPAPLPAKPKIQETLF